MNDNLTELVEVTTRQRLQVQRLLYRAVCLRNLIVGGQARFIGWASEDLNRAAERVAETEVRRAALWAAVSTQYQLSPDFSFEELLKVTQEPLTSMVRALSQEMPVLAQELQRTLALIAEGAADAHASASEVLARLRGVDPTPAAMPSAPGGGTHIDARL